MMVKDISGFSELTNEDAVREAVDLNKLLADVCAQLNQPIKETRASIQVDSLPAVLGIPLQLEQLFYHLISNAIKFAKKDTEPIIKISGSELPNASANDSLPVGDAANFVTIQLADNGIGIEASQLEKIFTIFFKIPFEQVREGEGVGLAYCRKIARNHSGIINVQSEFGQGTTFSISLPLADR